MPRSDLPCSEAKNQTRGREVVDENILVARKRKEGQV